MQTQQYRRAVMVDHEREIRKRIRDRRPAQQPRPSRSVRRAVGRSMISIGSRLAAEPQHRLARAR
jgi:hypothetical protein